MSSCSVRTFRTATSAYVVFAAIFGGVFALGNYGIPLTHPSVWEDAAAFAGAFMLVVFWLAAFQIRITDQELVFRSLFGGVRHIRHENIRKVRLGFDLRRNGGPLRLFVELDDPNAPEISINAKVFTREAIRAVLDLGARVATADPGGLENGIVARAISKVRARRKKCVKPGE